MKIEPRRNIPDETKAEETKKAAEGSQETKESDGVEKYSESTFQALAKAATEDSGELKIVDEQYDLAGGEELPDDLRDLGYYGKGTTLVEGEAFVRKRFRNMEASGDLGRVYFNVQSNIVGAQGRIFYEAGFDPEEMKLSAGIGAEGKVELIGAYYEFGYDTPTVNIAGKDVGIKLKGDISATVGAQGFVIAEASIGKDTYITVGGEAFAGARVRMEGSAGLGELGDVHGGMEAWAGIGAKAELDVGFEDGEVTFDVAFGMAYGLGFEVDWGFSFDVVEAGEMAFNAVTGFGDAAGEWFTGAADFGAGLASAAGEAGGGFLENLGKAAGDVAQAIADTGEDVVETAGDVIEEVAEAAEDTAEAVVDFVGDVLDW